MASKCSADSWLCIYHSSNTSQSFSKAKRSILTSWGSTKGQPLWYDLWEGKSNILMSRYAVPIGSNIFRNINIFTRKAFSFSLVQKRFQEDPIGVGELILFLSGELPNYSCQTKRTCYTYRQTSQETWCLDVICKGFSSSAPCVGCRHSR